MSATVAPGLDVDPAVLTTHERFDAFGFDLAHYDRWIAVGRAYHRWLRVRTEGLEHVPEDGPALLVCNHAGLRIYDMMCLQVTLRDEHPARRTLRGLGHIGIEKVPLWGRIMLQYAGTVLGHHRNAEYLLERGELVGVAPEGGHSTSKTFAQRDRLCPPEQWGSGWLKLALRTGVPVLPVAMSGFETAVPTIGRSRLLGRRWGMDDGLFPLSPQSPLTLFHPALAWTLPFPVACRIRVGAPLDLAALAGGSVETGDDLRRLSQRVRDVLDGQLRDLTHERRGRAPHPTTVRPEPRS